MTPRNEWDSDYMRRIPRSMQQAFNPYCDNELHPMPERRRETSNGEIIGYIVGLLCVMLLVHWVAR